MDASPESSDISSFLGLIRSAWYAQFPPFLEGLVIHIVAAGHDKVNGLLTYIRILHGALMRGRCASFLSCSGAIISSFAATGKALASGPF